MGVDMKEFGPDDGEEEEREAVLARGCPSQVFDKTTKYHDADIPDVPLVAKTAL